MVIDAYSRDIVCFCTHIEPKGNEDAISILSPFHKNTIAPFKIQTIAPPYKCVNRTNLVLQVGKHVIKLNGTFVKHCEKEGVSHTTKAMGIQCNCL